MFANYNGVYRASLTLTYHLEGGKKLADCLPQYLCSHWDFSVRVKRSAYTSLGALEVEVERAYTNQFDFSQYIHKVFLPELRRRISFICSLLKLSEPRWNSQFHFSVDNLEKHMGIKDTQINHGGRYFYNPEVPSNLEVSSYLTSGE